MWCAYVCVYAPASRKENKWAGQKMRRGPSAESGGPQRAQDRKEILCGCGLRVDFLFPSFSRD